MATVLVVDDKEMMRDSVCETLRRAGFGVVAATDGAQGFELATKQRPDAIVTDLKMPGMTGIELVSKIQEVDPEIPVIVMTAFGTIETAVDAMRLGAFDYVTKPFEGDELIIAVKRGLQHAELLRENAVLRSGGATRPASGGENEGPYGLERLIGESAAMRSVREQIEAVAGSNGTVLITGESGTGKEVVAQAIHEVSGRSGGAMLAVNCAALSESLLESELFGHERGAFTGADKLRKGRFELADGGTILLDEVSEVSGQIQAKLLRVLQERAFERVGSSMTIATDVRVVATSNRDLPASVDRGDFRGDLYFRLNVLPIDLPPLRERGGDAALLAEHFVRQASRRDGIDELSIEPGALDLFLSYSWPGNVRELQNICERAVVLTASRGETTVRRALIEPWLATGTRQATPQIVVNEQATQARLNRPIGTGTNGIPGREAGGVVASVGSSSPNGFGRGLDFGGATTMTETKPASAIAGVRPLADIERETIIAALHHYRGHRQKTAKALGIGLRTLGLKIKKWKQEQLIPETL
ncbi:MAG: sigma-54 dependent transcriptional regulator [Planctomycetota bacterium]